MIRCFRDTVTVYGFLNQNGRNPLSDDIYFLKKEINNNLSRYAIQDILPAVKVSEY